MMRQEVEKRRFQHLDLALAQEEDCKLLEGCIIWVIFLVSHTVADINRCKIDAGSIDQTFLKHFQ